MLSSLLKKVFSKECAKNTLFFLVLATSACLFQGDALASQPLQPGGSAWDYHSLALGGGVGTPVLMNTVGFIGAIEYERSWQTGVFRTQSYCMSPLFFRKGYGFLSENKRHRMSFDVGVCLPIAISFLLRWPVMVGSGHDQGGVVHDSLNQTIALFVGCAASGAFRARYSYRIARKLHAEASLGFGGLLLNASLALRYIF